MAHPVGMVTLGDLGYLNATRQRILQDHAITLWTPKRKNMMPTESETQTRLLKRFRKRIETAFSSLVRDFNLEQP